MHETWFKDCGTHQTWLKVYLLNDKEARAIKLILETMFIETNTKKHHNLYTCGFSLVKLQVTFWFLFVNGIGQNFFYTYIHT